jgi:hypothetical protein
MRRRRSFVFNFITYGGHPIDGLAAEELATTIGQKGMLALSCRLVDGRNGRNRLVGLDAENGLLPADHFPKTRPSAFSSGIVSSLFEPSAHGNKLACGVLN